MRSDKSTTIKLRLQGLSYSEIQKELGHISKSTLSNWLKDLVLSPEAKQKIFKKTREKSLKGLLKRNLNQTNLAIKRRDFARREAAKEIASLSRNQLLVMGIALYWAEGYKRDVIRDGRVRTYHPIALTNSDPKLVKAFLEFLRKICDVDDTKIKADLRIFQHLNEKAAIDFWTKNTGIPRENFTKTYVGVSKSSMNKRPYNRLPYGVIQVRIYDTSLFHKIMGWIEGLKRQF